MMDSIFPHADGIGAVSAGGKGERDGTTSISGTFKQLFDETAKNLESADNAVKENSTGGPVDLHDVMIAMEKADISLQMLVQVRNKTVDAYQEIMRMQI